MPRFYNGLGVLIVSTPKGVMTDHKARDENVGGEVLCQVFLGRFKDETMSRIGKKPVSNAIPEGVEINVDGQNVKAKGKLGELTLEINDEVAIKLDEVANDDKTEKVVVLEPKSNSRFAKQIWPTMRTLVNNIVIGVSEGYSKSLRSKVLVSWKYSG